MTFLLNNYSNVKPVHIWRKPCVGTMHMSVPAKFTHLRIWGKLIFLLKQYKLTNVFFC